MIHNDKIVSFGKYRYVTVSHVFIAVTAVRNIQKAFNDDGSVRFHRKKFFRSLAFPLQMFYNQGQVLPLPHLIPLIQGAEIC